VKKDDLIFLKYRGGKKLHAAIKDGNVPWTGERVLALLNQGKKIYIQVNKVSGML
jgi:hypothetical protein